MPAAPLASPQIAPGSSPQGTFASEKAVFGGISVVTLHGTLDHAFEGRKIAQSVHTKKLIVSMRDVRRFSSWGMTEWMDFLRTNAERDVYLVECSTYSASQLNLVTGLMGHCKLVSFYASYRCTSCHQEFETLFLIPRDRAALRDQNHECATCGGRVRMEEHPASFFEQVLERPTFDIDDEVLAFLRNQLHYDLPVDLTRFRAYRRARKEVTYLRLSGSITSLPADLLVKSVEGTTVIDMSRVIFDAGRMTPWRSFVQSALPKVRSLQLLDCPAGFLETAIYPEDRQERLKVRTFALAYDCVHCESQTHQMIDVAENLEELIAGMPPAARCATCSAMLDARLTAEQIKVLRSLPARDKDLALDKFIAKLRPEPNEKLEDCLVTVPQKRPMAPGAPRFMYLALGLSMVVVLGLVIVLVGLSKDRVETVSNTPAVIPQAPPPPTFVRPDWIISDVPSSAYCHDLINRLLCVGVSSYRPTRDEAIAEANDAALEELVSAVGLKISDPYFRETVMAGYSAVRNKALSELQAADIDRQGSAYLATDDMIDKARRRVVEIFQASGGPAVPTRRTDWYWEEYAKKGGGTETLVFVRYDVSLAALKALVDKYSQTTQVMHGAAMTAFPGLAWQYADFTGGAVLLKPSARLVTAGVTPNSIVMAVGDERVGDAPMLAKRLDEWKGSGPLKLTVKTGDAAAKVVELK